MNKLILNILAQFNSKKEFDPSLEELQNVIGYKFQNLSILQAAISHTSLENRAVSPFERMEFLGDSILGLITSEELFIHYPNYAEGQLSKMKSKLVSRKFLAMKTKESGINNFIRLSTEAAQSGGKFSTSILGDCMEALICAIYLDGSIDDARIFIQKFILKNMEKQITRSGLKDYKSILQEYTQGKFQNTPEYRIVAEVGPEHNKEFSVEVYINAAPAGFGKGNNKKEAQQKAAEKACQDLNL
ncbi:MAG: ribonuclease III [Candidatus Cloacimonadales bacterium]|nr:ribonuclease III [Candidatus Cloacimonadales bacterium]